MAEKRTSFIEFLRGFVKLMNFPIPNPLSRDHVFYDLLYSLQVSPFQIVTGIQALKKLLIIIFVVERSLKEVTIIFSYKII